MKLRDFMFWNKSSGFSTVELLIALGVTSALGLGGAYLMSNLEKNKQQLAVQTSYLAVEKSIEGFLISPRGCSVLEGKSLFTGDPDDETDPTGEISFKKDPRATQVFGKNEKVGDIEIKSLKIVKFNSFDANSSTGIAQVQLKMLKKGSTKGAKRLIPVSVNVVGNVVQNCNYNQTRALNDLKNQICAEAYDMAPTMTCEQVIASLENSVVEEICQEVYGAKPALKFYSGANVLCDFTKLHANKRCGAGFVQAFAADGSLVCRNISFPSPPTCLAWSSWSPATSTQCSGAPFTQTRTCTTPGVTATQPQQAIGTGPSTYTYNPADPSTICPSQTTTRTDSCTGAQTQVPGTSTASSCTTTCSGPYAWNTTYNCCYDSRVVGCFGPGSLVTMPNGGQVEIDKLKVGDQVLSFNESTGKVESDIVKTVFYHQREKRDLYLLSLSNGSILEATPEHLIYVPALKTYKSVASIHHDRSIVLAGTDGEEVRIVESQKIYQWIPVYNLHVAKNMNYFVGGVLVHNEKDETAFDEAEACCASVTTASGNCYGDASYPRFVRMSGCEADFAAYDACEPAPAQTTTAWGLATVCFVKGTPITMEDGSIKKIEDVKLGENILSFDESKQQLTVAPVTQTFHHPTQMSELYEFYLENGTTLKSNGIHPLYIQEMGDYLKAEEIYKLWLKGQSATMLGQLGEPVRILAIVTTTEEVKLYNLHVRSRYDSLVQESDIGHNYFANGVLVHNKIVQEDQRPIMASSRDCCNSSGAVVRNFDKQCEGTSAQKNAYDTCFEAVCPRYNPASGLCN